MNLTNLHWASASDAARLIREGAISSQQLVEACVARIREVDGEVQAWAFLDPNHALAQARAADEWRGEGRPTGPLHGIPVGVKDVIDTADMPTENGSVVHAGRTLSRDAAVVAMLRAAGAELFPSAAEAWEWQRTIMEAEIAVNLEREWDRGRDRLSESLRARLERGREVRALDYQRSVARIRPIPPPSNRIAPAKLAAKVALGDGQQYTQPKTAVNEAKETVMAVEEKVGVVTAYFARIGVAGVHLTDGPLQVGDQIRIRGHTTDFTQPVESLQVEHAPVERAERGSEVAVRVRERARQHDQVFRVRAG